jgi:hypothetical protein
MRHVCLRLALLAVVAFLINAQEPAAKRRSSSEESVKSLNRGCFATNQAISETDKGCCVVRYSAIKTTWEWTDGDTRANCAKKASDAGLNHSQYDFYKDQKCDDVRKKQ